MIRKLRSRFILAAMLAVFLVLFVIMCAVNILNVHTVASDADQILSLLEENGGEFPDSARPDKPEGEPPEEKGIGADSVFSPETPYESRYFRVTIDPAGTVTEADVTRIASVSESDAATYAAEIQSRKSDSGFLRYFRFRRFTDASGKTEVLFLDCRRSLDTAYAFMRTSILVSLVGLAAVLGLVIIFSRKFTHPIEESYAKQRRFITDAGHDLKTPLTIIDADISVLELDTGENEWTRDIKAQTKRLADLTGDLTYLARMDENPHLTRIDFPFSDLVEDTIASFRGRARMEHRSLSADIEPMLTFCGDEKAVERLLTILLDNALKYSDENGWIRVGLKKKGKELRLTVRNSCEPIDRETISHLFDRFYRADSSRNSEKGGYGLGLSIASATVAAHKGKIAAASEDGHSLLITVVLPASG